MERICECAYNSMLDCIWREVEKWSPLLSCQSPRPVTYLAVAFTHIHMRIYAHIHIHITHIRVRIRIRIHIHSH